jgi:hypothetical protein
MSFMRETGSLPSIGAVSHAVDVCGPRGDQNNTKPAL